jgi:RNA polymerase sigma-70 factor (ECF subfamily)
MNERSISAKAKDRQTPEPGLEALMEAYQNGDREAANQLIECLSPALHRFFALHTGDRRHADDILQDAWLRIHKARHTYRPGEPLLPWIYAIARHVKVDAFRRRRPELYEQRLESIPEPVVAPLEGKSDLPDIESLLAHLPASQREVIAMLKVSGLSLEEVARATSSSVGAVKQKAHRAYEKLRVLLVDLRPQTTRKAGAL